MKKNRVFKLACQCCGTEFYARSTTAKYCRPACQVKAYRQSAEYRQKALAAEYAKQTAEQQPNQEPTEPTEVTEEATQ